MINYINIARAINYYTAIGYTYIDVPWQASMQAQAITCEHLRSLSEIMSDDRFNVGSAEQSFLQMILDGNLPRGKYVACTPCYRDELVIDELHLSYFMKVELIDTLNPTEEVLFSMVAEANEFFRMKIDTETIVTDEGMDIIGFNTEIELGSYGLRTHPKIGGWVYGTGCAEPRFSTVVDKERNSK